MSTPILTEPGHTKFNLTHPPLPFNSTGTAPNAGSIQDASTSISSTLPGILLGILIPHIICSLTILARTSSRLFLLRKWFLDDTLIVLAWVFSTSVCIVYSIASQQSPPTLLSSSTTGNTAGTIPSEPTQSYILRTYIGLITYQLSLLLTKLSILTFYFRIFSAASSTASSSSTSYYSPRQSSSPSFLLEKRLSSATIIFVILYGVPLLFMSVFQCHPAPGQFFSTPMKCFTFVPLLITSASLHTATDAWLILLIIPCILRLDLPRRQKFALGAVLSLGVFVIAASLTRLQLSLRAGYAPAAIPTNIPGNGGQEESATTAARQDEVTKNTLVFFVMTVLELDVALICASAPTLRPILARFWPRLGMGESSSHDASRGRRRRRRSSGTTRHSRWWWLGHPLRWRGSNDGSRARSSSSRRSSSSSTTSSGSVGLTSVSYHGYPWTRPVTPAAATRSKNPSLNNLYLQQQSQGEDIPDMPMPPLARISTYRTPTTLSLRSFISNLATPRSRGGMFPGDSASTTAATAGDRTGLLPNNTEEGEVRTRRRRSSVGGGFDGYFDQYYLMGYSGEVATTSTDSNGRRRSRNLMHVNQMGNNNNTARNSMLGSGGGGGGRWMDSQESFVLGVNDPNSPCTVNRLSPVLSDSGTLVATISGSSDSEQQHTDKEGEKEEAAGDKIENTTTTTAMVEELGEKDI